MDLMLKSSQSYHSIVIVYKPSTHKLYTLMCLKAILSTIKQLTVLEKIITHSKPHHRGNNNNNNKNAYYSGIKYHVVHFLDQRHLKAHMSHLYSWCHIRSRRKSHNFIISNAIWTYGSYLLSFVSHKYEWSLFLFSLNKPGRDTFSNLTLSDFFPKEFIFYLNGRSCKIKSVD